MTLEWVASHQDDELTIDIKTLSTRTQLKIEADKHATKGINRLYLNSKVPLNPSSGVMIHQGRRTITRDLKVSIRYNIQLPVLEKYYQKQIGWSNSVYGKIDLEIFTPVYRRNKIKHFKWINKLYMRKLPPRQYTRTGEFKYNKRYCSYCAEYETNDHLLQCQKKLATEMRYIGSLNLVFKNTRITVKQAVTQGNLFKIFVHVRDHNTTYGATQDTNPPEPTFHIMV